MNNCFLCGDSCKIFDNIKRASFLLGIFLTSNLLYKFSEKGNGSGADGEDPLPDGHHRERLLWVAVHRPQPCQSLAGPNQTSQEAGQK